MSWDYFALFAIVALLFWGWGAFAAWRGKRPAVVYTFDLPGTWLSFLVSLSVCGFLWNVLRCGRWERPVCGIRFFFRWRESSLTAVGSINGFSVSVPFCHLVFVCINIFKPEIHNKTLMPALQSPWFTPHVIVYMFAYAMLGAATVMAVYLLWFKKKGIERHEMALCDNSDLCRACFHDAGYAVRCCLGKSCLGTLLGMGSLRRLGRRLPGSPIWHISISDLGCPAALS